MAYKISDDCVACGACKPEAVSGKQPNPNHLQEALKNMGDMGIELPEGLRDLLEKK